MKQVRAGTRRSSLTFSPSRASGEPSVSVTVRSLTRAPGAESARLMKTRDDKIRPSSTLIVPKGRLSGCERSSSRRQHPATRRQQRRLKGTLIFNLKTPRSGQSAIIFPVCIVEETSSETSAYCGWIRLSHTAEGIPDEWHFKWKTVRKMKIRITRSVLKSHSSSESQLSQM